MRIVTRPDFDGVVCAVLISDALGIEQPVHWVEPNEFNERLGRHPARRHRRQPPLSSRLRYLVRPPLHQSDRSAFQGLVPRGALGRPQRLRLLSRPVQAGLHRTGLLGRPHRLGRFHPGRGAASGEVRLRAAFDDRVGRDRQGRGLLGASWCACCGRRTSRQVMARPGGRGPLPNGRPSRTANTPNGSENTPASKDRWPSRTSARWTTRHPATGFCPTAFSRKPSSASASVTKMPSRQTVVVNIGHSIFNPNCNVHVGRLLAEFGGGGHRGAASARFPAVMADSCLPKIIGALMKNLPD
ncbi:MAG: hypothetical protein MZV70_11055 [Desulfobacterales bacterium]|nr:hypothetical protein [Desulfobacterales bacterium]